MMLGGKDDVEGERRCGGRKMIRRVEDKIMWREEEMDAPKDEAKLKGAKISITYK